jgi:hypothetical protein
MVKLNMKVSVTFAALSLIALGVLLKVGGNDQTTLKQLESETVQSGSVQGENLGLPKELPKDLVFYPDSTLLSSSSSDSNSQVSLATEEKMEKVKNFYDLDFNSKGWKTTGNGKYTRNNEKLEIEFLSDREIQSVVIINYSFVPTR